MVSGRNFDAANLNMTTVILGIRLPTQKPMEIEFPGKLIFRGNLSQYCKFESDILMMDPPLISHGSFPSTSQITCLLSQFKERINGGNVSYFMNCTQNPFPMLVWKHQSCKPRRKHSDWSVRICIIKMSDLSLRHGNTSQNQFSLVCAWPTGFQAKLSSDSDSQCSVAYCHSVVGAKICCLTNCNQSIQLTLMSAHLSGSGFRSRSPWAWAINLFQTPITWFITVLNDLPK